MVIGSPALRFVGEAVTIQAYFPIAPEKPGGAGAGIGRTFISTGGLVTVIGRRWNRPKKPNISFGSGCARRRKTRFISAGPRVSLPAFAAEIVMRIFRTV